MLRDSGTEDEIAGEQTHQERASDVHDQGAEGKAVAEDAGGADIDPVPERAADACAQEDDEIEHRGRLLPAEQFFDLRMTELHPGRAAMVALARTRRDLHLSEQSIHLRD